MDSLIAANTKFCFDLLQKISKDDYHKNIFFCPLSLSAAFGMVRLGARSDSAHQIDEVLHFNELSQSESKEPDPCVKSKKEVSSESSLEGQKQMPASQDQQDKSSSDNELLNCYFGTLLSRLDRAKEYYTLSMANRLYGEKEFTICPNLISASSNVRNASTTNAILPARAGLVRAGEKYLSNQEYIDGVSEFYHTTIESVDFRKNTEESRQEINFWVESQCEGKIKDLFSKDTIDSSTVLVLVNAVYFKAKWEKSFDCENTVDAPFSLSENEKKTVKMMNQKGRFRIGFIEELQTQILEMKYTLGKLSMFILLPPCSEDNMKGLRELENKISHENIMTWSSSENMSEEPVAISFPQFTLEGSYDLNSLLQDMGITDIFDETKADLSGISQSPNLYLSKIIHKSFVEVDEIGTQAAAASGVVAAEKSLPSWVEFNANHPFIFFIRHNKTQTILFYGRVCSP